MLDARLKRRRVAAEASINCVIHLVKESGRAE